jgi:hypothetical protein
MQAISAVSSYIGIYRAEIKVTELSQQNNARGDVFGASELRGSVYVLVLVS